MAHMMALAGEQVFLVRHETEAATLWAQHGSHEAATLTALRAIEGRGGRVSIFEAREILAVWKPEPTPLVEPISKNE